MGNSGTKAKHLAVKAFGLMTKPLKNYNLESRAHKVISQDKPIVAPKHKSEQASFESLMREYPEVYEESLKKNVQLDEHLKKVFVQSHDKIITPERGADPDKPFPLDRRAVGDFEYGVKEPEKLILGRLSLRQVLKFLSDYQSDGKTHTAEKISVDYSVPKKVVDNILNYYNIFEIYIPQERESKAKFAGPTVPRVKIVSKERLKLEAGKEGQKEGSDTT